MGGLDLTKHEVMKVAIAKFSKETRPKFVGVRHLIDFEADDFLTRPDVHAGLAILENHGLTFDLQSYPATIQHIPLIAGKFPKLKMVIDHIAKPHYMQVLRGLHKVMPIFFLVLKMGGVSEFYFHR